MDAVELKHRAVVDIRRVVAWRLEWRSVAWQRHTVPRVLEQGIAIRLFGADGADNVLRVGARVAFWDIDAGFLARLWKAHPDIVGEPDGTDEVSVLFGLTQQVLGSSDKDTLDVIKRRWKESDLESWYSKELLALDEALQVLDRQDINMVHADQKHAESKAERWRQFSKHDRANCTAVRAGAKGHGCGKGGGKVGKPKKDRAPVGASIDHETAKKPSTEGVDLAEPQGPLVVLPCRPSTSHQRAVGR
jgi:hypothetical protein